jgi:hypothetical protein
MFVGDVAPFVGAISLMNIRGAPWQPVKAMWPRSYIHRFTDKHESTNIF